MTDSSQSLIGKPHVRVDGLAKVTGQARYASDEPVANAAFAYLVTSSISKGQVRGMDLDAAHAVRGVLESFAARQFARLRRPADIAALKRATKRLNAVEKDGTPLVMLEVGTDFYGAIAAGSGNPYLAQTLGTLHHRITLIRFISLHQRARITSSFAALRRLSKAIQAGDEALADRLCTDHLDAVGAMARSISQAGYRVPGSANDV